MRCKRCLGTGEEGPTKYTHLCSDLLAKNKKLVELLENLPIHVTNCWRMWQMPCPTCEMIKKRLQEIQDETPQA